MRVEGPDDLQREIYRSETSWILIPEIDLEQQPGISYNTTVGGLLEKIIHNLVEANPFGTSGALGKKFREYIDRMQTMAQGGETPFTLILDDLMANCFVNNAGRSDASTEDDDEDDPQIEVDVYLPSFKQIKELGLSGADD